VVGSLGIAKVMTELEVPAYKLTVIDIKYKDEETDF
jgi:hypothetical protein